jgi:hypothetical protein
MMRLKLLFPLLHEPHQLLKVLLFFRSSALIDKEREVSLIDEIRRQTEEVVVKALKRLESMATIEFLDAMQLARPEEVGMPFLFLY